MGMLRKMFCILAAAGILTASGLVYAAAVAETAEEQETDLSDAVPEDGILSITEPGTYRLSGNIDGQIRIDAGKESKVTLILAGVTVTNDDSALSVLSADKVILETEEGTENILKTTGAENESDDGEEDASAAIQVKGDLTIRGSGTLTVDGGQKQGIRVTKDLVIKDGTLIVNAQATGIRVKDDCTVKGGTVTVTAGKDGFQVGTEASGDEASDGKMELQDGSVTITSDGDAVQCAGDILISGGSLSAVTGGGQASAAQGQDRDRWDYGWDMDWYTDEETEASSCKGLKAEGRIQVGAGTIRFDCCDDALHSDQKINITGGDITVSSGDDGLHADEQIEISNGNVTITSSYEGIEANQITVSGGYICLTAEDDGFNANGGSSSYSFGWSGGHGGFGSKHGQSYWGEEQDSSGDEESDDTADAMPNLIISGGTVLVNAKGDGLDSNGNICITGGYTVVDGPSDSMNGALDSGSENGGTITVTGGTLLAIGASGMAETFEQESTQMSFLYYCSWDDGDVITISGDDGKQLMTHTAVRSGSAIVFTCPELKQGDTVTVTCGTTSGTIELTGITTINDSYDQDGWDSWSWWNW